MPTYKLQSKKLITPLIICLILLFGLLVYLLSIINGTQQITQNVAVPNQTEIPKQPVKNQVVLSFKEGTSDEDKKAYIKSIGAEVKQEIKELNTIIVTVKETASYPKEESKNNIVAKQEPDYYVSLLQATSTSNPNDPRFNEQWIFTKFNLTENWNSQINNKIAVIDSGICLNHPDLVGKILEGYDFIENDTTPQDANGHGCEVSGVIAANINNNVGIAGVSKDSKIMPLRVLDKDGIGTYSNLANAIIYATDNGATVINLSLGGVNSSSILENAVNYAKSKNVKIFAAAGNLGTEGALYPAAYDYVIAVGSLNQNLEKSTFSNYGANVDIYAPGENILTTTIDGGYKYVSGTSFAAPIVSGVGLFSNYAELFKITNNNQASNTESEDSNKVSAASAENPSKVTNVSGRDIYIVVNGKVQRLSNGSSSTSTEDVDGIWAECSLSDLTCKTYSDSESNTTKNLRVYKFGDGSSIKVYSDMNNNLILSGNVQGEIGIGWQSNIPSAVVPACVLRGFIEWESYGSTKFGCIDSGPNAESRNAKDRLQNVNYTLTSCVQAGMFVNDPGKNSTCPGELANPCQQFDGSGIVIYKEKDCLQSSDKRTLTSHGQIVNLKDNSNFTGFEDEITSIKVSPGWSIQVYQHYMDYLPYSSSLDPGQWTCIDHSMWNLAQDRFTQKYNYPTSTTKEEISLNGNGEIIDNQISSFKLFNNSNCGGALSCNAPLSGASITAQNSCGSGTTNPTGCSGIPDGKYCGSTLNLTPNKLYQCKNGVSTELQSCSYGCNVQQQGVADYCNAAPSTGSCPNNLNGNYCGSGLGTQYNASTLYNCNNGNVTVVSSCSLGCIQKPPGTNDVCKVSTSTGSCPSGGNGNYCGSTLGLDANKLYNCNNGAITLVESCANGCQLKDPGTPDVCYPVGQGTSTPSQEKAILFGNSDYTSPRLEFSEGSSDAPDRGSLYKSLKLPSGWSAILYDHPINGSGGEECFSSSSDQLESKGWYNSIDAIKVANTNICSSSGSKVEICTETGKNGTCKVITTDVPSLGNYGFGNDTLKSIYIEGDWYAILFEDDNYGGRFYQTNSINGDLGGIPFGYGASSIKVFKTNPAAFSMYRLGDFNDGNPLRSDRSMSNLEQIKADSGSWNDRAQSMRVSGGYEVIVCSEANSHGVCGRTKNDQADLNSLANGLRNGASSVVVCINNCPATSSIPTRVSPIEGATFIPGSPTTFSWVGNGEEYLIEIWGGALASSINSGWIKNSTTWSKIGLAGSANTYYWHVKSWSPYGETNWSSTYSFKIQDIAPQTLYIDGKSTVILNENNTYKALVSPSAATNLTYTWSPTPNYGQGTSVATYNWGVTGNSTISLTVSNTGGSVSSSIIVNTQCPSGQLVGQYYKYTDFSNLVKTQCESASINYNFGTDAPLPLKTLDFGTGIDGDLVVPAGQTNFTVNHVKYALTSGVNAGTNLIPLSGVGGLAPNDEVIIIKMQGNNTGQYQTLIIDRIEGLNIITKTTLNNTYETGGNNRTQIMRVPNFNNVTVGGKLTAYPWDGTTGGLLIFKVKGTLNVQTGGLLDAKGMGYRSYYQVYGNASSQQGQGESYNGMGTLSNVANGSGGGGGRNETGDNAYNIRGAGGGGHATAGGSAASGYAQGGAAYGNNDQRASLTFGGAGGVGGDHWRLPTGVEQNPLTLNGGGIIFIQSNNTNIQGTINANGETGWSWPECNWCMGGGGAGGSVFLVSNTITSASNAISAIGASSYGSRDDRSGDGGQGRIHLLSCDANNLNITTSPAARKEVIHCGTDNFAIRWTGSINLPKAENIFKVTSDDGIRVWLDGNLIIDKWINGFIQYQTSVTTNSAGDHSIKIEYYEATGSAQVKFEIQSIVNNPPTITSSPVIEVDERSQYSYQFTASDSENNTLSYDIFEGPTGMSISSTGLVTWSPTKTDIGSHNVVLTVFDGTNEEVSQEFTILVKDIQDAPLLNVIPDQILTQGQTFNPIDLKTFVTDEDLNETFAWSASGNSNIQINIVNGVANITYNENWFGEENVTFTVTDSDGLTASRTLKLKVNQLYLCTKGTYYTEYFNNIGLTGTPVSTGCTGVINYAWSGAPKTGVNINNFSIRWTGYFDFTNTNDYYFTQISNNGMRVWVDNTLVIDDWADHTANRTKNATVRIEAGVRKIKVEYYDKLDGATAKVSWKEITKCSAPINSFCGEYFNNATLTGAPVYLKNDPAINFAWSTSGPGNGLPVDNFSVRWVGKFNFNANEYYFTATSDEGIRLWIDDTLIIDDWVAHTSRTKNIFANITAGEHIVKVEYYERTSAAKAIVSWKENIKCTTPDNSYCVEYFNNKTLTGVANVISSTNIINYSWAGSPTANINADNFSARWQGNFDFLAGSYKFSATSDNGIKVWVDDVLIINDWTSHTSRLRTYTLNLTQGKHKVKVEYYDATGTAVAKVNWVKL